MPRLIALAAIGVTRNGNTIYPPVGSNLDGEPFDFTDEEVAQIRAVEKSNDVVMLRELRNEGPSASSNAAVDPNAPQTFTLANTGNELKAEATARGLDFSTLKTKAELVALLDANPVKTEAAETEEDL